MPGVLIVQSWKAFKLEGDSGAPGLRQHNIVHYVRRYSSKWHNTWAHLHSVRTQTNVYTSVFSERPLNETFGTNTEQQRTEESVFSVKKGC
jgi:CDP-glycerol glycerophosphotransferase (TagB/SpsB family)